MRREDSDAVWAVLEGLMLARSGGPWVDYLLTVEGIAWKFRTGGPWWDVPRRFEK